MPFVTKTNNHPQTVQSTVPTSEGYDWKKITKVALLTLLIVSAPLLGMLFLNRPNEESQQVTSIEEVPPFEAADLSESAILSEIPEISQTSIADGYRITPHYTVHPREELGNEKLAEKVGESVRLKWDNRFVLDKNNEKIGYFKCKNANDKSDYMVSLLYDEAPKVVEMKVREKALPDDYRPDRSAPDDQYRKGNLVEYVSGEHIDPHTRGASLYAYAGEKVPYDELQKLTFLDLLIQNSDRHRANMFLRDGRLVPIDHDHSCDSAIDRAPYIYNEYYNFNWEAHLFSTGYRNVPYENYELKPSPKAVKWVMGLDVEKQLEPVLDQISKQCYYGMILRQKFLKAAVASNLTFGEIMEASKNTVQYVKTAAARFHSLPPVEGKEARRKIFFKHFQDVVNERFGNI